MALINEMLGSLMTLTPLKVSSHEQLTAFSQGVVSQYGFSDSYVRSRINRKRNQQQYKGLREMLGAIRDSCLQPFWFVMKLHYKQKPKSYNKMEESRCSKMPFYQS